MLTSESKLSKLCMTTQVGQKLMLNVNGRINEYTVVYKDAVRVELSLEDNAPILATTWAGLDKKLTW